MNKDSKGIAVLPLGWCMWSWHHSPIWATVQLHLHTESPGTSERKMF